MAIITKEGTLHEKAGCIEYKMPEAMARELLKNRKGDDCPYAEAAGKQHTQLIYDK